MQLGARHGLLPWDGGGEASELVGPSGIAETGDEGSTPDELGGKVSVGGETRAIGIESDERVVGSEGMEVYAAGLVDVVWHKFGAREATGNDGPGPKTWRV